MGKVVRKIKNTQFKTRNQLQYLSDLIFKYVHERPDKIKEYAHLCKEVQDLKVTILRFETIDEKESLEIASLRFHILLATRVEIAYDQLGAVKDGFKHFNKQMENGALLEILRVVKHQMAFAGELYKYDLLSTEFLFATINRLSVMAEMSGFFLECLVSFLEQTAKGVEAQNFSLGRYFKQLRKIAKNNAVDGVLIERIKELLKLRATKWLGGEQEVPPECVECLIIDESYKQKTLGAIEEELKKYISLDKCRSCCLEFEPSDRLNHLTSKKHTTSMQTLLRDQYDGNLISCRERSCVICQEVNIEKPFVHFNTQQHKINCTTFCYICQTKFKSAFYLSMHLKSLIHRKELLRLYDTILETKLLDGLIAKENDILASDDSDNDDTTEVDYEKFDKSVNDNTTLRNNIFKYLYLITTEDQTANEPGLHDRIVEQLDKFIENIYVSKNISTENTLEMLKQFDQDVEDVKATVKCVRGEFPIITECEVAKDELVPQINLVKLLKDQYVELCVDMKQKLEQLKKVKQEHIFASEELLSNDSTTCSDDQSVIISKNSEEIRQIVQKISQEAIKPDSGLPDDTAKRLVETIDTLNMIQENMNLITLCDTSEKIKTNLSTQTTHRKSSEKTKHDTTNKIIIATESTSSPKDSEENKSANVTKEKNCNCEKRKSILKSGKNKKARIKNKKIMAENIGNSKICQISRQKCMNETCELNLVPTSKGQLNDQSAGSSNYRMENAVKGTTGGNIELEKISKKIDCAKSSTSACGTDQEGSSSLLIKENNSFAEGANNHEKKEVIKTPTPNTTLHTAQGESSQKNSTTSNERLSEIKEIRIKTFAKLKRKIPEKLRSEGSSKNNPDKVIVGVIGLIKRVYMTDDIPLRVILELIGNFNKDLESKIRA